MLKAPSPKPKKTSMLEIFGEANFLPNQESRTMLALYQRVSTGVLSEDHATVEMAAQSLCLVKTESTTTTAKSKP